MSKTDYNIEELGFTSWFELYEWLRGQDLQDQQSVTLTWPEEVVHEERQSDDIDAPLEPVTPTQRADVKLPVNYVKAKAFEELYEQIPSKKAIDVLIQMVDSTSLQSLAQFLNKLPTRSHD